MFGAMGGGRRTQAGPSRGSDLRYNLDVSLEEAFRVKQTTIRVATFVHCDSCKGNGADPDTRPPSCRTCHSNGLVRRQQGFFILEQACPTNKASGQTFDNPYKSSRCQC